MSVLFLFAHTLERIAIGLLVDEAAGIGVPLHKALIDWIENLGPLADCTVAMPVSFGWVCSHSSVCFELVYAVAVILTL